MAVMNPEIAKVRVWIKAHPQIKRYSDFLNADSGIEVSREEYKDQRYRVLTLEQGVDAEPQAAPQGSTGPQFERHIIPSDYHIRNYKVRVWDMAKQRYKYVPMKAHDPRAMAVLEQFMDAWLPTDIWYDGDMIDFHQVSKFCRTPRDQEGLQNDLDELIDLFARHKDAHPTARRRFLLGNHDARFEPFIEQYAPALSGLTCLSYHSLFQAQKLGLEIHRYKERVPILPGLLEITHGDSVAQKSGYTAHKMLQAGISGVSGHVHRLGTVYQTRRTGTTVWAENGCLCSLTPDYVENPDWQQGFTIIYVERHTKRFHLEQIPIINGRIVHAGKVYEA